MMTEEPLSAGQDFEPQITTDDGSSVAAFESIIEDLSQLESDNIFTEDELKLLTLVESLRSTKEFHKLIESEEISLDAAAELYQKITAGTSQQEVINQTQDDSRGSFNLQEIFVRIVQLKPLKTSVDFL